MFPGRLGVIDPAGTGHIFSAQTQWVADNAEALRIGYVGHLGDIVEHGDNLDEWARAKFAMNILLAADVPHGLVMGNHDAILGPHYRQNYLDHFGPQTFDGRTWYSAASPGGGGNFQRVTHEGRQLGFINFSIDQPQEEIDWANQIISDHPATLFVLGTHRYIYDLKLARSRYGEKVDSILGPLQLFDLPQDGVVAPNTGQQLFEKLVSQHRNVLMVQSGHYDSEWLRLTNGYTDVQRSAIQLLTNYQSARNGGDGWLRIYELDFENNTFSFRTYSPTLDRERTTFDHFVETIQQASVQLTLVMAGLGRSEADYLGVLDRLRRDVVPGEFLRTHPDYDEPSEQAYYDQLLADMFAGIDANNDGIDDGPPPGFDKISDWEGLWLFGFAADPDNPFDFRDSDRSPRGTVSVDYTAFVVPEPGASVLVLGAAFIGLMVARSKRS